MLIAAKLKRLLDELKINYSVLVYTHLANLRQVVVADVLTDDKGPLIMVRPLNRPLDLRMLKQVLHRDLSPLPTINANRLFQDCEAECWPPVGRVYTLPIVIDASVLRLEKVFFTSGSRTAYVRMRIQDFLDAQPRYRIVNCTHNEQAQLCLPSSAPVIKNNLADEFNKLPSNVQKLLAAIKTSRPVDIVPVIKNDVLLQNPSSEVWRHAVLAAERAQALCKIVSPELDDAKAYLAGLLQNFGLLLFSYLFPPEHRLLQKWLRMNPKASIVRLEQRLLGMGRALHIVRSGHADLGAQLLAHFGIAEDLCAIVRQHHSKQYVGPDATYIKIIQLTNQTLRRQGLGDGDLTLEPAILLDLGLTSEQVTSTINP